MGWGVVTATEGRAAIEGGQLPQLGAKKRRGACIPLRELSGSVEILRKVFIKQMDPEVQTVFCWVRQHMPVIPTLGRSGGQPGIQETLRIHKPPEETPNLLGLGCAEKEGIHLQLPRKGISESQKNVCVCVHAHVGKDSSATQGFPPFSQSGV